MSTPLAKRPDGVVTLYGNFDFEQTLLFPTIHLSQIRLSFNARKMTSFIKVLTRTNGKLKHISTTTTSSHSDRAVFEVGCAPGRSSVQAIEVLFAIGNDINQEIVFEVYAGDALKVKGELSFLFAVITVRAIELLWDSNHKFPIRRGISELLGILHIDCLLQVKAISADADQDNAIYHSNAFQMPTLESIRRANRKFAKQNIENIYINLLVEKIWPLSKDEENVIYQNHKAYLVVLISGGGSEVVWNISDPITLGLHYDPDTDYSIRLNDMMLGWHQFCGENLNIASSDLSRLRDESRNCLDVRVYMIR